jgi:hypothetical protein
VATATKKPKGNGAGEKSGTKPNILVIFGDDIGIPQVSAYTQGLMGYRTPNIDRIAEEGALFTDAYGQQSCTAGRASFILGQEPFRTGLLTIGMPGDPHGITDWMPTIADVMKSQGYATGQFGKNHLGDRDEHLPTNHGFDEFFGNLYHLNAVRFDDWKVSFAIQHGNIATGSRTVTNWAGITNLRMDPYEKGTEEGGESLKFFAQQMWLLVPIGNLVRKFFADFETFPYQAGTALNAGNINYSMLRTQDALHRLSQLETLHPTS